MITVLKSLFLILNENAMTKFLPLICILGIAQPSMAASISNLGALTQPDFKTLSEDLGAALSYKPVTPAASLGIVGFDVGIEATQTSMSKSSQIWKTATNGSSVDNFVLIGLSHTATRCSRT